MEPVLLEDLVRGALESGKRQILGVFGESGAGKSSALEHLRALFPGSTGLVLWEDGWSSGTTPEFEVGVFAAPSGQLPFLGESVRITTLCAWGPDEYIEYLLARHPAQVASVMSRIPSHGTARLLDGLPAICVPILDALAGDPSLETVGEALRRLLAAAIPESLRGIDLLQWSLRNPAVDEAVTSPLAESVLERHGVGKSFVAIVRHPESRKCLAIDGLTSMLRSDDFRADLATVLEPLLCDEGVLRAVGAGIPPGSSGYLRLGSLAEGEDARFQGVAASLLLAADPSWRPAQAFGSPESPKCTPPARDYRLALLDAARWNGGEFSSLDLRDADVRGADLSEAKIGNLDVRGADLTGTSLRAATMSTLHARGAVLRDADFRGAGVGCTRFGDADLRGASFEGAVLERTVADGADLRDADFRGAALAHANFGNTRLEGCDFTGVDFGGAILRKPDLRGARLDRARFRKAFLPWANLEGVEVDSPDFALATVYEASLSNSRMVSADFTRAVVIGARLAGISWPGADLRNADLRGATFHLGSSRSGLVSSCLASEGTRTGFYTDEYFERGFRTPEEIRRADLRGADLRGARIDDVDFYLVDLRGARYDRSQREQFVRCRAILEDRTRGAGE